MYEILCDVSGTRLLVESKNHTEKQLIASKEEISKVRDSVNRIDERVIQMKKTLQAKTCLTEVSMCDAE